MYQPELETLPREKLRALQEERLKRLVVYVYERVPFYRRLLDEAGVDPKGFRGLEDLPRIPFTKKTDLRDHYPFGLFAVPREEVAINTFGCREAPRGMVSFCIGDVEIAYYLPQ